MKFNGYSKEYLQEKAHEYRQKGLSLFKIKEKFAEELGVEISHTTIANRLKKKIDTQLEQLNEINKQIEYERPFEFEDDNIVFYTSKRNKYGDKVLEKIAIPIDIVKQIRADYSKHGGNLSQQQILVKYNLNPHAWHVMKNRLGLYKDSDIVPDWLLEKIEKEKGEEGVNEKIEEISYEAVHNKYRNVLVKRYERVKNKEYEKAITKLYDIENFLMMLREFIDNYEPKEIDFDIEKIENSDKIYAVISDIHIGKKNTQDILKRIKLFTQDLISRPEGRIEIFCLGDLVENLVIGGKHPGMVEDMDGPFDFELIMETVNIFEQMLLELYKAGKDIKFVGIGGNHDLYDNRNNLNFTAAYVIYELIKRGLSNTEIKINYLRGVWHTVDTEDFVFILNHGTGPHTKKNPKDILWEFGKTDKQNIILQGDKHHAEMNNISKNAVRILNGALAGPNTYDENLGVSSYTGYTIIKKGPTGKPKVEFVFLD